MHGKKRERGGREDFQKEKKRWLCPRNVAPGKPRQRESVIKRKKRVRQEE